MGQYYCVTCARHFVSQAVLEEHNKTRPHKRLFKLALEEPYSHREAEAAAGMGPTQK